MTQDVTTAIEPRPVEGFVETPFIQGITERALGFIHAGFPIHFRGISGTGKTTLAMQIASMIGRPIIMLHGDDELSTSDLVGRSDGYRTRRVVDNFVHHVWKKEEDFQKTWVENRLTVACRHGFTLIYDEFTRARPEANNVLLSVLQEKMLDLPVASDSGHYLHVSPEFTAIFTSNPEEYAGVHKSQDALRDRLVTLDLDHLDEATELGIAASRSGLRDKEVGLIVKVMRAFRAETDLYDFAPTVRAAIMIAKTVTVRGAAVSADDPVFRQICVDVLGSETTRHGICEKRRDAVKVIDGLIDKFGKSGEETKKKTRAKTNSKATQKEKMPEEREKEAVLA